MQRRKFLQTSALSGTGLIPQVAKAAKTRTNDQSNSPKQEPKYQNPVLEPDFADPTVIRSEDGMYYAYATRMHTARSTDLVNWESLGTFLESTPDWKQNSDQIWAPDITYYGGKYLLYYSLVSVYGFGAPIYDSHSPGGIGVAISDTPEPPFEDHGKIFTSSEIGVPGSIDPMFFDDDGTPYLFWGSFAPGIYGIQLTDDGLNTVGSKFQIAGGRFEGSYIIKRNGMYYLFVSSGTCCNGPDGTYRVEVGRSDTIDGPYVNKHGEDLMDAPGTVVLDDNETVGAPGHNSIATDDSGTDWIVYHAYERSERGFIEGKLQNADGESRIVPRRPLFIDPLEWKHGWPSVEGLSPSREGHRPIINQKDNSKLELSNMSVSTDTVEPHQPLTASVTAENTKGSGTERLGLYVDKELIKERPVVFDSDEIKEVSFELRLYRPNEHTLTIGPSLGKAPSGKTVTVNPKPAEFNYSVFTIEGPSTASNTITATANFQNIGSYRATKTVDLGVDGSVVDSNDVTLNPGELTVVSFTHNLGELGLLEVKDVSIGKLEPKKVTSKSLHAYWKFNNSNEDSSGGGHRFSLLNSAGYDDQSSIEGNYSLHLDGSDDSARLSEFDQAFLSDAFAERTVSMWVNPDSTAGLQELYNEGGTVNGLALRINDDLLEAGVANDRELVTISSSFTQTDWTHVAVVFDNGSLRLYVAGTEVASQSDIGYAVVGDHVAGSDIGSARTTDIWNSGDAYFDGHVDATAIYSRALSADEVSTVSDMF